MTSGGIDVIVISASDSLSTTGDAVDVVGDNVSTEEGTVETGVVATGGDGSTETTDGVVETDSSDTVGANAGSTTLAAHKAVRNTKTTSHRPRCGNLFDVTLSPQSPYRRRPSQAGHRPVRGPHDQS
jgi:hypothetical protein